MVFADINTWIKKHPIITIIIAGVFVTLIITLFSEPDYIPHSDAAGTIPEQLGMVIKELGMEDNLEDCVSYQTNESIPCSGAEDIVWVTTRYDEGMRTVLFEMTQPIPDAAMLVVGEIVSESYTFTANFDYDGDKKTDESIYGSIHPDGTTTGCLLWNGNPCEKEVRMDIDGNNVTLETTGKPGPANWDIHVLHTVGSLSEDDIVDTSIY